LLSSKKLNGIPHISQRIFSGSADAEDFDASECFYFGL
jgi:hypothetical protein